MTVRLALVVAVVLSTIGIGVVYAATFIRDALSGDVPSGLAFLFWSALTTFGFFLILGGLLTFYGTYITERSERKREHYPATDDDSAEKPPGGQARDPGGDAT